MAQRPSVCIVTTAHPVDDVRVSHKFSRSFREAGYQVTWVGPSHSFFEKSVNCDPSIEYHLSPPIASRIDRLSASSRIWRIARELPPCDVYYAPEPDSASIAIALARPSRAMVILDIHEVYHGALLDRWTCGMTLRPLRVLVQRRIRRICAECDLVVGVNEAVLGPYISASRSTLVVRNCAPSWFRSEEPADVCGHDRKYFTMMHGKGSLNRGTLEVLEAIARAAREVKNVKVVVIDFFANSRTSDVQLFRENVQRLGIERNLDLRAGMPMQAMPHLLSACDVGMIAYRRRLGEDSLPNRLFEYMAVGLPVLAPKYSRPMAEVVTEEQCGVLVDFEDPFEVSRAIIELHRDPNRTREMGRRAHEAFTRRHNWQIEVRPVIDRIEEWYAARGSRNGKSG